MNCFRLDDSINNPHDRFVRRFLGETEQARQLVEWQLPAEVVAQLKLDSIAPANQSFVDETLRESLSDLVFHVELASGGDALVVLLFEHKCTDEDLRGESLFFAHMLLLKYIQRDELPERLPEILRLFGRLLPPATGLESLETMLRYLVSGTDRVSREQLRTAITETLRTEGESIIPTIDSGFKKELKRDVKKAN